MRVLKIFSIAALATLIPTNQQLYAAEGDEAVDDDVIIVTASKRQQGLQQSPIAITVVGEEAIERTKILDIYDLQAIVPTLRVTPLQRSVNTSFTLRGFGNGSNNTGIEPSVGVFIDGVYRSRSASQIGDLPRLDQIEILSGPQSTLFGKNASAGVINVRTKTPSHDFEGKFEAGFGNYNQQVFKGYITNEINDTTAFSLSAGLNTRDGYTESIVGLGDLNTRDRWNVRGQMLFEPTADVTLRLIADMSEIDEVCCTVSSFINGPTAPITQLLGGQVTSDTTPFSYESALNSDPTNKVEDSGFSLQADINFDGFTFVSITAMRTNESGFDNDVDFSSLDVINESANVKIETFTQEFRLTSTGKRKLDWMVGAFIFQEDVTTDDTLFFGDNIRSFFDVLLAAGGAPGLLAGVEGVYGLAPGSFFSSDTSVNTAYTQDNKAYSIFATFDYHISDEFTATFGMSYTNDEKDLTVTQTNTDALSAIDLTNDLTLFGVPIGFIPSLAPAVPILQSFQFLPPMLDFPNSVEDGKSSDSATTWTVRLAYEVNENVNIFATAATGFKATSWNLSRDTLPFMTDQTALIAAGLARGDQRYGTRSAAPEEATVYELGMKTRFEKGAFNITYFDQTIEEFQSSIFIGTGFVLANAGQQSTTGVEFDSVFRPNDNWTLTLAGTFLDPIYDSFAGAQGPSGPIDLTGKKPAGVHETSIVAGIMYDFEFDSGAYGYIRSDYIYESEALLVANLPDDLTREVSTLNASAGVTFNNDVSIQLWVRNLNDDEYFMSGFPTPIQAGSITVYPNQPQTFGATISYEF